MVGDLFEQFDLRTCDSDTQVSKRQCCSNVLLDKFYTKISCVKHIVKIVQDMFPEYRAFVEPSAGSGNISEYLRKIGCDVIAYDIAPEHENIIKADYLLTKVLKDKHLTIGNPPFGYKGKLAIEFLNKALTESDVVAFIMPITALKYSVQKNILKDANLLYQEILPRDSFELPDKENYSCASVFQVWSSFYKGKNLRAQKPVLSHKDFVLYRHNATQQSARYIDCDWDFAVYAQGRKDYHKRFFKEDYQLLKKKILETSDQFYFFKALNQEVLERLLNIDFHALAHTNHITPGFCKNDIVAKYMEMFEE